MRPMKRRRSIIAVSPGWSQERRISRERLAGGQRVGWGKGAWHNGNNEAEAYRAVPTIEPRWARRERHSSYYSAVPGAFAHPTSSHRLDEHVALLARRQLDHAFGAQILRRQHLLVVRDGDVVDLEPARL